MKIVKVYGSYSLTFRRFDGEWTIKRLSTNTHSLELAEKILTAIETMPIKERTKEAVEELAHKLWEESR